MNPEEKVLMERVLKLSEKNNEILLKIQKAGRWAVLWGILKAAFIIVPLVVGYIYLQPFFGEMQNGYNDLKELMAL